MNLAAWRNRLPRGRRAVVAGVALAWIAGLLGAAVPMWQKSVRMHREIAALDREFAELEHWSVAGLWLENAVARREASVDDEWNRLFPADRRREELFLDLARIADRSGVALFTLVEVSPDGQPLDGFDPGARPPVDLPEDEPDDELVDMPAPAVVSLETYRVRARFEGDYEHTASFIGGLRRIERAVNVASLIVRPASGRLAVELELEVYVSKPLES